MWVFSSWCHPVDEFGDDLGAVVVSFFADVVESCQVAGGEPDADVLFGS